MGGRDGLPGGVRRFLRLDGDDDLDDELAEHFRRLEEDLVRDGMKADEAKREARRRFGDETEWRRRIRAIDRSARRRRGLLGTIDSIRDSLASAGRGIRTSPGLSLAIVLAFALGIGANATVYGILDRLLLRPPAHVQEPDGVVRLQIERDVLGTTQRSSTMSFVDVDDFEGSNRFAEVAAFTGPLSLTVGRGEGAERVGGSMATADFFTLLGVQPLLGRFFTAEEDAIGAPGVVVLGEAYWRRSFGASRDVLGRTIDFGHGAHVIIGVAPRGFTGINLEPVDLWLPMRPTATHVLGGEDWLTSRGYYFAHAVARLADGATRELAGEEATRLHRNGRAEGIERGTYDGDARVVAGPLIAARGDDPDAPARVARWLAGVSLIVLLIACINVANLLLARALRRRRELSIRLALGVSRTRLIGDAITEGLVLAGLGGIAALAVARWGGDLVRNALLPNVDWSTATFGPHLVAFVCLLALIAGVAAALVPAVQATRSDVNDALRASAGAITRSALRTRGFLSLAQTALSVLLLVGAGLFVRSLSQVGSTDLGFVPDGLLVTTFVTDAGALDDVATRAFFAEAVERVHRLPFVSTAAAATSSPMRNSYSYALRVPGLDSIPRQPTGGPYGHAVSPAYFETMGIRILRGRSLADTDRAGAPAVVVVNEAFARLVWPGEEALGKCVHVDVRDRPDAPCAQVVGVAATARRDAIDEIATAQFYMPLEQRLVDTGPDVLFVRLAQGGQEHAAALRRTLLDMEPRLRDATVRPILDFAAYELRPWRLGATLFTAFGIIALVVAALGLYSVLAFDVDQRTREIGLRSALGARMPDVIRLVVARAAALTALGIVIGSTAALLLAPRLRELLYQTEPRDPVTFLGVALLLLLVAAFASALPAWRAARVDPNVALRAD